MKFGSLFAGIGGIDLGLERAGMECIWQVENDDYCKRVLEKHWPDIPRYGDVREQHGRLSHIMEADGYFGGCKSCLPPVDLIAGGFPCQPHSVAGKRKGAEDDRNLWPEFIRIIRELKPRYVIAENVPGIITTYLDTVLSDLEGEGYICATFNLPAVAFDAPHRRERIFIVAYAHSQQHAATQKRGCVNTNASYWDNVTNRSLEGGTRIVADSDRPEQGRERQSGRQAEERIAISGCGEDVSDSERKRLQGQRASGEQVTEAHGRTEIPVGSSGNGSVWTVEPDVGRVAHGVPSRVDRLRGLGNAVVPQVAQWIGERILEFDNE